MALPLKRLQRTRFPQAAISAPRVLNAHSPILTQDLHAFLATALAPSVWSAYSEAEKRNLIDLLPAAYRTYTVDDGGADGTLACPLSVAFLQSDAFVRVGVARFKRDVAAGCWEAKWQEQARKARLERQHGAFDEYLKDHAEELFGEDEDEDEDEHDDDDAGELAEDEDAGQQSGSEWEERGLSLKQKEKQKQKLMQVQKKEGEVAEEEFIVESLLRHSPDGSRIQVKWRGYAETTWESRRRLMEDLPDMMVAWEAQTRSDVDMDSGVEEAVRQGGRQRQTD